MTAGGFAFWDAAAVLAAAAALTRFGGNPKGRGTSIAFRGLSGLLLFLIFFGFARRAGPEPRGLAVVFDESASMAASAGQELETRWERSLRSWRRVNGVRGIAPRFFRLGDGLQGVTEKALADGRPEKLRSAFGVLAGVKESAPDTQAILFFTDGRAEEGDPAAAAASVGIPILAVGVGRDAVVPDLGVEEVRAPRLVFAGAESEATVRLVGRGLSTLTGEVSLWAGRRRLAAAALAPARPRAPDSVGGNADGLSSDELGEIPLRFSLSGAGPRLLRVEAAVQDGETNLRNNRRVFAVDVHRDRLRVLYLCGRPGPHYGFLRAQLKTDPAVELVSFVILRDPEDAVGFPDADLALIPFPAPDTLMGQLKTFDVVILEDFPMTAFGLGPRMPAALREYVRRGGGLLLAGEGRAWADGGPGRGNAWEDLLPPADFIPGPSGRFYLRPAAAVPSDGLGRISGSAAPRVRRFVTDRPLAAAVHPLLALDADVASSARRWAGLPPLEAPAGLWPRLAGGGVLAEATGGVPWLSARSLGRGRVALLASLTGWRWALGGSEGPWAYQRFWENAVRWLGESPDQKRLSFGRPEGPAPVGEPWTLIARVAGENPPAVLRARGRSPEGAAVEAVLRPVGPGDYAGSVTFPAPGFYEWRVTGDGAEDDMIVEAAAGWEEALDVRPNFSFLARFARETGGDSLGVDDLSPRRLRRWLSSLPTGRAESAGAFWFWAVILLLAAEWLWRRISGSAAPSVDASGRGRVSGSKDKGVP